VFVKVSNENGRAHVIVFAEWWVAISQILVGRRK